tara:strand:- start:1158 stop:1421 length:264 start_codon:yes stop_codon:yes gene_type:complete
MPIVKKPFVRYNLEKKSDTFTVKLNPEERKEFENWKYLLQQEKDSTAIKQLAKLGAKVLLDEKTKESIQLVLGNYRKNKRLGIVNFD